jgi:hypothetical protein
MLLSLIVSRIASLVQLGSITYFYAIKLHLLSAKSPLVQIHPVAHCCATKFHCQQVVWSHSRGREILDISNCGTLVTVGSLIFTLGVTAALRSG